MKRPIAALFGAATVFGSAVASDVLLPGAINGDIHPPFREYEDLSTNPISLADFHLGRLYYTYTERVRRDGFLAVEQKLNTALAVAAPGAKSGAVQSVALFYLAHGYAPEALAALEQGDSRPEFDFLRGVASYEIGRFADAVQILTVERLRNEAVVKPWLALALDASGVHTKACEEAQAAPSSPSGTPAREFAQFHLLLAECALAASDVDSARTAIEKASAVSLGPEARARRGLIEAKLQRETGRAVIAKPHLQRLAETAPQPYRALSELEIIADSVSAGDITAKDAAGAIESTILKWSGDRAERSGLALLGEFLISDEQYREGLAAWRRLIDTYPVADAAKTARLSIAETLTTIAKDKGIAPAEAAAIFLANIEYAPPGAAGDEIIRQLADGLLALDLPAPAAELLDHQTFKRLRGAARSESAARLAEAFLSAGAPSAALRAIRSTRLAKLPDILNSRRRLLEARALQQLGEVDAALELLSSASGAAERRLRGDIYWNEKSWLAAGNEYGLALKKVSADPTLLDTDAFDDMVLRMIAANAMAGETIPIPESVLNILTAEHRDAIIDYAEALSRLSDDADFAALDALYQDVFQKLSG